MKIKGGSVEYTYKKETLKALDGKPFLDEDLIEEYSAKIKSVLDIISRTDGIIFIYSNWIKSGVIPLVLALEQNGYKKFSGDKILNYPEYNGTSKKYETKRKPKTFVSKDDDKEYGIKYMVISGGEDKLSRNIEEELKIITSPENHDGKRIKIVIGSSVASEGIDFKRIRAVHILEPWLHLNRLEQTIGRAIRFCSHGDLDPDKRNVMVYLHALVNTPDDRETIDSAVYRYAEKKAIDIGNVEDILKRTAIDRLLFRHKNIVGEKDVVESNILCSLIDRKTNENIKISYAPNDKPYSKICSYLPKAKCNFNKELSRVKYDKLFNDSKNNDDTRNFNYSDRYIEVVAKRIIELYTLRPVYEIDEILQLLSQFYNVDDKIVYLALHKILIDKRIINNHLGIRGKIIYRGKYYIFQPIDINDDNIPYYYRCYPEIKYPHDIYIPKAKVEMQKLQIASKYEMNDVIGILNTLNSGGEDEGTYIDIFDDIDVLQLSFKKYEIDRLDAEMKTALIYIVLMNLNTDKELFDILSYNFIYKKNGKYKLRYEVKDNNKDIVGFYVIFHHRPQFFALEDGTIRKMNTFERKDIQKEITRYTRTDGYRTLIQTEGIW